MAKSNRQGMSVGVVSLITIFVVFLLASLAILSLTTSRANSRTAEKALAMQTAYYQADLRAQERMANCDDVLRTVGPQPEALSALGMGYDMAAQTLSYTEPIDGVSAISVQLKIVGNTCQIQSWKQVTTDKWQAEETIDNLWKGN